MQRVQRRSADSEVAININIRLSASPLVSIGPSSSLLKIIGNGRHESRFCSIPRRGEGGRGGGGLYIKEGKYVCKNLIAKEGRGLIFGAIRYYR